MEWIIPILYGSIISYDHMPRNIVDDIWESETFTWSLLHFAHRRIQWQSIITNLLNDPEGYVLGQPGPGLPIILPSVTSQM